MTAIRFYFDWLLFYYCLVSIDVTHMLNNKHIIVYTQKCHQNTANYSSKGMYILAPTNGRDYNKRLQPSSRRACGGRWSSIIKAKAVLSEAKAAWRFAQGSIDTLMKQRRKVLFFVYYIIICIRWATMNNNKEWKGRHQNQRVTSICLDCREPSRF